MRTTVIFVFLYSLNLTFNNTTAQESKETIFNGHESGVNCARYSPDGRKIVSGSWDRAIKVWDANSGQEIHTLNGHTSSVSSVSFSPDGKNFASGSSDKTIKIWDTTSGKEILTLKGHSDFVFSVSFSPDGKKIVSGSWDKTIKVWDATSGKEILTLNGHLISVTSVSFSPDGKRIVSGSTDRAIKVWDATSGQEILTLRGHSDHVNCVSFSPDGKKIASGSTDKTIKVWDANSGQEILTLKGHKNSVLSVSFSPDGKRIASGSTDKTIKVWDANSGQETLTPKEHTGTVKSVSFSPNGRSIVSGSWDKTVKVWDVADESKKQTVNLENNSLRKAIIDAGFDEKIIDTQSPLFLWNQKAFKAFVEFGNAKLADKFDSADAFDKIDIKKECSKRREALTKMKFTLDGLGFTPDTSLLESKGLILELYFPFRIGYGKNTESQKAPGILVGRPHPCDAGAVIASYYYLTKDGKLSPCANSREILEVRRLDGILYRQETLSTTLILTLKGDETLLKQIARNPKEYSVTTEFTSLRIERPRTWGFFKEKALQDNNWDCDDIRAYWPPLKETLQPNYFVTATGLDEDNKVPEIAIANLETLKIIDKANGKVVGGYNLEEK